MEGCTGVTSPGRTREGRPGAESCGFILVEPLESQGGNLQIPFIHVSLLQRCEENKDSSSQLRINQPRIPRWLYRQLRSCFYLLGQSPSGTTLFIDNSQGRGCGSVYLLSVSIETLDRNLLGYSGLGPWLGPWSRQRGFFPYSSIPRALATFLKRELCDNQLIQCSTERQAEVREWSMCKAAEAWGALACRGGVRRDVGKEAMGHAVIPGMLKNLLFVFLKIIHTYSLRRQVFEYILLHYTKQCYYVQGTFRDFFFFR